MSKWTAFVIGVLTLAFVLLCVLGWLTSMAIPVGHIPTPCPTVRPFQDPTLSGHLVDPWGDSQSFVCVRPQADELQGSCTFYPAYSPVKILGVEEWGHVHVRGHDFEGYVLSVNVETD